MRKFSSSNAISKIASIIIVIVIIAAGIIGYIAYTSIQKPVTSTPTTIPTPTITSPITAREVVKIAVGIEPDTIDPHGQTTTLIFNIMRHVYETIVWFDENGNVIPWLAESWTISSDGLTYTFKLRKDVKFHDGSKLNAETIKMNIERWIDPTVRVPVRVQLGPVKGAEVVDEYTVKIILKEPFAPFLRALGGYLLIASSKAIEKYKNATITEPSGTGPYKFVKWEKGKLVLLERNEDYWGSKPLIRSIEWRIIPEAATREAALLAGDVDVAFLPPPSDISKLQADPKVKVLTPITNRIIFIGLLPKGPLKDPRVRQALNYAVDKKALIDKVLFGLGIETNAPVPPHFFGFYGMEPYSYNPEKAKQLLKDAGYPEGFKMVLLHPTGRYIQDKQVAEAVQAYLSRIGVEAQLVTMDWPSFVAKITKPLEEKDYDALLLGWGPFIADADYTLYAQFHSTQAPPKGLAAAHYNNSKIDDLLAKARRELNEENRKTLYKEIIGTIWNDAPWIFLYTQKNFLALSVKLEGVWIYVDGEQFFFHKAYFKP
ncbi:MAG: ABC transporter substrate-binding protein [Candidatus Methanomethylicia archaeon]